MSETNVIGTPAWQTDLSALADGEAGEHELAAACRAWRDDAAARAAWHSYALIGDVLRSDELASTLPHDARFMQKLHERLAQEPVVLAPRALAPARRWAAPVAMAAGVLAVVGVTLMMRPAGAPDATLASSPAAPAAAPSSPVFTALPQPLGAAVARNVMIDRYLAAHRQAAQGVALAAPGSLRQVAVTPEGR